MDEVNQKREYRINYEIIVDCYDDDEVDYAWFSYMEDNLLFPFSATAPFKTKDGTVVKKAVKVVEFDQNSERNLKVGVVSKNDELIRYVRILDLEEIKADEWTIQAIEDWRYWKR